MKVSELIGKLQDMPQDAEVWHLWDGEARTCIELAWLARDGIVITSDYDQVCYSTGTRPEGAPTFQEDRYWSTPGGLE